MLSAGCMMALRLAIGKGGLVMDESTRLEAMRIAKDMVKAELRRNGFKISSIAAKQITISAKAILKHDSGDIERRAKRIVKIRSLP